MDRFKGETFQSLLEILGDWKIEFKTNRRFIDSGGLRFWEHGTVETLTDFYREPGARSVLARHMKLEVYSSNEVLPYELCTPEGEKVPKAWLKPCQLLFDMHAMVVVHGEHLYGEYPRKNVKWLSPTAFPIPSRPIEYTQPDRKAENRMWKEVFDARWHEARVLRGLGEMPKGYRIGGCEDSELWNPACRDADVILLLVSFEKQPFIERYIKPKTNKVVHHEFLRFK